MLEFLASELEELREDKTKLMAESAEAQSRLAEMEQRLFHLEDLMNNAREFAIYRLEIHKEAPFNFRVVFTSNSYKDITGIANPQSTREFMNNFHPDDLPGLMEAHENAFETNTLDQTLRIFVPQKGEWRWIHYLATGIAEGQSGHFFVNGVAQDVTERKRIELELEKYRDHLERMVEERTEELEREIEIRQESEERLRLALAEKEVLLRETHHRVKNNLQSIVGLLELQSRQARSEEVLGAFQDCRDRVRAMCMVHQQLYGSKDLCSIQVGDYLRSLADALFRAYDGRGRGIGLELVAEEMGLEMDQAFACGMVLNELLSNSLKHAFPSGRGGMISFRVGCLDDGLVEMICADDGVGLPPDFDWDRLNTLGLRLVHMLVTGSLDGTIQALPGGGTVLRIVFAPRPMEYDRDLEAC